MKKVSLLLMAFIALTFASCEKDTTLTVNLTWEDSKFYDLSEEDWKASLYMGALTFIKDGDYDKSASETIDVTFEASAISLSESFKSFENLTVVVFADLNKNGKYDMGENSATDFGTYEGGENETIEMNISY